MLLKNKYYIKNVINLKKTKQKNKKKNKKLLLKPHGLKCKNHTTTWTKMQSFLYISSIHLPCHTDTHTQSTPLQPSTPSTMTPSTKTPSTS